MMHTRRGEGTVAVLVIGCLFAFVPTTAQAQVDFSIYRSLGDSLTHGTQGGKVVDYRTQPHAYPILLAEKMGTPFPLGLLSPATGSDVQSRLDAPNYVLSANLAVNGAQIDDAVYRVAEPLDPPNYDSDDRTDLVLAGRPGATQVSAAVDDNATFITAWLGGNDFLNCLTKYGSVLSTFGSHFGLPLPSDPLNVSELTGQASFAADYATMMSTLNATAAKMAVANFPELQHIAGVLTKSELTNLIGPNPMPEDAMTSELMAAVLLFDDVSFWGSDIFTVDMMSDPANYWDASEVAAIDAAIQGFNQTIATEAALHNAALVDIRSVFANVADTGVMVGGWEINADWFIGNLGEKKASVFSSDGCHPSDIGHALIANAFIDEINDHFGADLDRLSEAELIDILANDKFVDNDLDGTIEGITCPVQYLAVNTFTPDFTGDTNEVHVPEPFGVLFLAAGGLCALRRRKP